MTFFLKFYLFINKMSYRTVNTTVTAKSLLEVYRPLLNTIGNTGTTPAYTLDSTLPGGTPTPPFRNTTTNVTPAAVQSLKGALAPNGVDESNNASAGTFSNSVKRTVDLSNILRGAYAYTGYGGTGSVDGSIIVNVHY
jgi:hypothetical protein